MGEQPGRGGGLGCYSLHLRGGGQPEWLWLLSPITVIQFSSIFCVSHRLPSELLALRIHVAGQFIDRSTKRSVGLFWRIGNGRNGSVEPGAFNRLLDGF